MSRVRPDEGGGRGHASAGGGRRGHALRLRPADLQNAYKLPSATAGAGRTVAVVDAYGDPNAAEDLSAYRAQYGLPPCTEASGCFTKVDQRGGNAFPEAEDEWAMEISLDLDMVSAACPKSPRPGRNR